MKIVFMGTPDFAVPTLEALYQSRHEVAAVVTQPDKPKGRGKAMAMPPVKEKALEYGIPVYQPVRVRKDEAFFEELTKIQPDVIVVIAFGQILPERILNLPKYGCINIHASLLPKYRGAAPINWAVINGDTETGITTFFLKHEIDTGEIIDQVRVPIADTDNVEVVYERLMRLGGDLVLKTVDAILEGSVKTIPQEELAQVGELRPAPKIFKATCRIDWTIGVKRIYDFVRGLSPYPAAWTELYQEGTDPVMLKIFETEKLFCEHSLAPGTIVTDCKTYFKIASSDGYVNVLSLQLAGKKRMEINDFLRGYRHTEKAYVK